MFQFGAETSNLYRDRADTHVVAVKINGEKVKADAYVMALGSYSARWMRKRHVPIPVYPVKGYSLTLPVGNADAAPVSTIMDETYKVAITRLGDRIRVGGTAEISGYDLTLHESRRATLEHSVERPVSRRGGCVQGELLVRPAPHDAGWPADHRPDPLPQSVRQHRPRHAWLDHGLRLRKSAGGHHVAAGRPTSTPANWAWNATPDR